MNFLSYIFFVSILPSILSGSFPFLPQTSSHAPRSASSISLDYFSTEEELFSSHEDVTLVCNYTLFSPKKVINPYKSDLQNYVPQKPFGSFYQKCAVCLAVANQIGSIIDKATNYDSTVYKHQAAVNEEIAKNISDLCSSGFKDFDLRSYNDVALLSNHFKCTSHVNTNMDGNWTKKLREMCSLYTSHMDLEHMSNNYADKTEELVNNLCKESGIFRDCVNVQDDYLPVLIEHMQDLNKCSENCSCSTRSGQHSEIYDVLE